MGPAVLLGSCTLTVQVASLFQGIQERADSVDVHRQASGYRALSPLPITIKYPSQGCPSPLLVAEATCQHKENHNLCPVQTRVFPNTTPSSHCQPSRPNILRGVLCLSGCFLLELALVAGGEKPVPRAVLCCNSYS